MALFRVSNERAQFDAAGNEASDQYGAGIRFTQGGNARVTTATPTNYNQGIPMSATGQVAIVDATAGLPAGTIFHNGLPISADKVCVSRNATAVVSNGLPYDAAGAVAADVNLDLNFIGTDTLNSSVTFTRASTATYFDSAGVLTSAAINAPRFDYNPATLAAQGLLIEEQRTNSIRNNTMQGAVAGTPGTLPTNWATFTALTGLTQSVVGTGTENGITYIDVRLNGTPSGAGQWQISPETTTQIVASSGQTWTSSIYYKLAAGSLTGISTTILAVAEYTAAGGYLDGSFPTLAAPSGTLQRGVATRTLNNASTARVLETLFLNLTGAAIDITLRIGLPQLEQGAFATSVIPTTTTALTRSADVASVNTLSPWYNQSEGTLYAEWVTAANDATNNRGIAALDDGSNNNRVAMFVPNSFTPLAVAARVVSGGTATNPANAGSIALSSIAKSALTYGVGTNQAALCVNGATPTTASPAAAPIGVAALRIGAIFGVTQLGGWVRRITYYPRKLSSAELQAITA